MIIYFGSQFLGSVGHLLGGWTLAGLIPTHQTYHSIIVEVTVWYIGVIRYHHLAALNHRLKPHGVGQW